MKNWKTEIGRREDLEAIEVNKPEGYIASLIYPIDNTVEKSGDFTAQVVQADISTTEDRAHGAALSGTDIVMENFTYTCKRQEARSFVDKTEIPQYGDIALADAVGAKLVKRAVLNKYESDVANEVFSDANYVAREIAETGALIDAIQNAAEATKGVEGKTALVLSRNLFAKLMKRDEIKNLLESSVYTQLLNMSAVDQLSRKPELLASMLQQVYMFDMVLVGDNKFWGFPGSPKNSCAAVVKLTPQEPFAHKMDPVLGKTKVYWPAEVTAGSVPCEIEASVDTEVKRNVYDGEAYYELITINEEGVKLVDFNIDIPSTTTV